MTPGHHYLINERHLTEETVKTFHLAYKSLEGHLYCDSDFPAGTLDLDPRFNGRVWFPIFDMYNNLIGISARILIQRATDPKYINTVYPKANHLFGLNVSWKECLRTKTAYVVEGNVDMIRLYQAGIKNVVGMLGSNLTETQLCLLSRFVKKVVLVPDGDTAGEKFLDKFTKAIDRKKFSNFDLTFTQVHLPIGYDPDKFVFEKGKAGFEELERNSITDLVFKE
jgi:DNA primase